MCDIMKSDVIVMPHGSYLDITDHPISNTIGNIAQLIVLDEMKLTSQPVSHK